MFIYQITNLKNGKRYIGQTINNVDKRWKKHKKYPNYALSEDLEKYGEENFLIEIIARANSYEELAYLEKEYIRTFNTMYPNGYNLTDGGRNIKMTEEHKNKISKSNMNKAKKSTRNGKYPNYYGVYEYKKYKGFYQSSVTFNGYCKKILWSNNPKQCALAYNKFVKENNLKQPINIILETW